MGMSARREGAPVSLRRGLASLPRAVWVLDAGLFVNSFGTFLPVFIVLYLVRAGYPPPVAALGLSAYGLGALLGPALGGYLADRLGRRDTIAAGMAVAAAAVVAVPLAHALPIIAALVALSAAGSGAAAPAGAALVGDLGYAAGPAAAGVLAGHAFPLLFAGDAATSLAFGAIVLLRLPRDRPAAPPARARGGFLRAARRDGTVVRLLAAMLAIHLVYWQQLATLPLVVTGRGLPAAAYGLLLSVNGLVVILCELPLTAVTRRLAPRRAIALGFLLIGAGFALLAAAGTLAALVACVLVWTLGEMIWDPVASAYLATLAPPHLRGRYQGAFSATVASAYVVAPALGGALYARSPVAL